MTLEVILNPGSDSYANVEERIMNLEGNITEKRYRIQVMLEDVELYQSFVSSEIISST